MLVLRPKTRGSTETMECRILMLMRSSGAVPFWVLLETWDLNSCNFGLASAIRSFPGNDEMCVCVSIGVYI